jgi:hypothetical protein
MFMLTRVFLRFLLHLGLLSLGLLTRLLLSIRLLSLSLNLRRFLSSRLRLRLRLLSHLYIKLLLLLLLPSLMFNRLQLHLSKSPVDGSHLLLLLLLLLPGPLFNRLRLRLLSHLFIKLQLPLLIPSLSLPLLLLLPQHRHQTINPNLKWKPLNLLPPTRARINPKLQHQSPRPQFSQVKTQTPLQTTSQPVT